MPDHTKFVLGQIVVVKATPSVRGAVVEVVPGEGEHRVKVFVGQDVQTYFASQLQAADQPDDEVRTLSCEGFHAYLTARLIRHPSLSTLYSLNAARVDFIPYQFRPVLKFIRSDRPRMLIADGVGVGKTVEAGLILRELQARRDISSVLIVCPRPLVTERKWQIEMKRFDQRFTHLDGATLRYCIREMDLEGEWPEQHRYAILPYSLFDEALLHGTQGKRSRRGLLDLEPPPKFDLVIVDEAHHVRNSNTYAHQAVRFFCDHAEAAVFLTATPIQLDNHDLFVLLNVLRPDLIRDYETFRNMSAPNPFINRAASEVRAQVSEWPARVTGTLDEAAATPWGQAVLRHNPEFIRVRSLTQANMVPPDDRVRIITDIEDLHTFSGIINRTRRRDIGAFTVRKPETAVVEFTPVQRQLHDELINVETDIFVALHRTPNVEFMLTMIRRQAASCLYGLAPFIEDILTRHVDDLPLEEGADFMGPDLGAGAMDTIRSRIRRVVIMAQSLDPHDPKLERLRAIIRDKQALPNNKIMLFSSFRHTLSYLYERLVSDGIRVAMIHGGTADEERVELRGRFERPRDDPDSLDLLLFSEIGCEGLDYQFCDCIVNYDLPWNPMRVEQRIGRIDRNGQKSESIAIFNLITPGTVDADIYERCLRRIGVFESALGGSEEILGEITKEIRNIAENFHLSESERQAKLQQLADNKIRLMQEQDQMEHDQLELFGIRLPEDQMRKEIDAAASFWLTPASLHRLVARYLQRTCGSGQEYILGEKPLKTLRLAQDRRNALLRDLSHLHRQNTTFHRQWETWLRGGEPHLPITFDAGCAAQHPEAAFIMPLHPLVKQATLAIDDQQPVVTTLTARTASVAAGRYGFAIYQWRFHGVREDLVLQPIASSDSVTQHIGRLLERAVDADSQETVDTDERKALDDEHYRRWSKARSDHRHRTNELVRFRRESLSTSHRARMALLNEQLRQTEDAKIRRMRQSQIAAAEADYARRTKDLDGALETADIVTTPVAYGTLTIAGV